MGRLLQRKCGSVPAAEPRLAALADAVHLQRMAVNADVRAATGLPRRDPRLAAVGLRPATDTAVLARVMGATGLITVDQQSDLYANWTTPGARAPNDATWATEYRVKSSLTDDEKKAAAPLSHHHVIPKNRLVAFYNTVKQNGDLQKIAPATNKMVTAAYWGENPAKSAVTSDINPAAGALAVTKDQMNAEVANLMAGNNPANQQVATLFAQIFHWFPGNLVEGPSSGLRADDPGPGFDEPVARVIRSEDHWKAHQAMGAYIAAARPSDRKKPLREAVAALLRISARTEPYAYDPAKWVMNLAVAAPFRAKR